MKRILTFIISILFILLTVNTKVFADSPLTGFNFRSADEVRKFIIATRGTEEEYREIFKRTAYQWEKAVGDKILSLPFITVKDGIEIDECRFYYEKRTDNGKERWSVSYTIDRIHYNFQHLFYAPKGTEYSSSTSIELNLDGYDRNLTLYKKGDKYVGRIFYEDIALNVSVRTDNAEDIDMSCFNLGELSLELDSERTTDATTAVTTETPSASTTRKEETSNSTVKNAFIVIGIVIITAAVSSALTAVIMRRRRE